LTTAPLEGTTLTPSSSERHSHLTAAGDAAFLDPVAHEDVMT
jgi:hypothetical protein